MSNSDLLAPLPSTPSLVPFGSMPAALAYDEQRFFPVGPAARIRLRAKFGFHGRVILGVPAAVRGSHLDDLLAAFARVARREPLARLHLAIVDPQAAPRESRRLTSWVRRVARSALLRGRVRFAPIVGEADRPDLYRAADLFACPAADPDAETCALEAMASGTPTVLSARGELQRTFTYGRHALCADPADDVDFGLTLAQIFRHQRLRLRLARMGAHQTRSLFTSIALTRRIEETASDISREPLRATA